MITFDIRCATHVQCSVQSSDIILSRLPSTLILTVALKLRTVPWACETSWRVLRAHSTESIYNGTSRPDQPFDRTTSPNGPTESRPTYSNRSLTPLAGPPLYSDLKQFLPAPRSLKKSMADHPPVFDRVRHDWPQVTELQRSFHSFSPGARTSKIVAKSDSCCATTLIGLFVVFIGLLTSLSAPPSS